jgi:hypothetical protein
MGHTDCQQLVFLSTRPPRVVTPGHHSLVSGWLRGPHWLSSIEPCFDCKSSVSEKCQPYLQLHPYLLTVRAPRGAVPVQQHARLLRVVLALFTHGVIVRQNTVQLMTAGVVHATNRVTAPGSVNPTSVVPNLRTSACGVVTPFS